MMKAAFLSALMFTLLLGACAAPRTTVETDDQSGTLVFRVNPGSAEVYVDGQLYGKAREFNGDAAVLKVDPGTHLVKLKAEGYYEYEKKLYISDTQERIEVNLRRKE